MSIGILTILIIVVLILLIGYGTPISFATGFLSLLLFIGFMNISTLYQIAEVVAETGTNLFMITVPLFVLMAEILSFSGVGNDLFTAAHRWLSWLPGGLAISSIGTCTGFAAVSGSSPATAATVGMVAIPEMIKRGYNRKLAVGAIAAGGTLGILIPPSIAMIIFGIITEVSIGKLFIAGIVPGIFLAILLSAAIAIAVKVKPALAPPSDSVTWPERFSSLKKIWPFIVLSVSVIGSIYAGIATPTESAAIGVTLSIIIALIYRRLTLKALHDALRRSAAISAMIIFLVIGGSVLAFVLSFLNVPQALTNMVISMEVSRWVIMVIINIVLLVMGCLMDPMGVMVITLPIFFPIITQLGFDPVWFGIVVTVNVEIGMITPPVGLNLFVLKGVVPDISLKEIYSGSIYFVLILFFGLAVIMSFPALTTWLPGRMGF
jgi:C4-dicarboxylate transporter, DctM subunit